MRRNLIKSSILKTLRKIPSLQSLGLTYTFVEVLWQKGVDSHTLWLDRAILFAASPILLNKFITKWKLDSLYMSNLALFHSIFPHNHSLQEISLSYWEGHVLICDVKKQWTIVKTYLTEWKCLQSNSSSTSSMHPKLTLLRLIDRNAQITILLHPGTLNWIIKYVKASVWTSYKGKSQP